MRASVADLARNALADAGRVVERLDAAAFESFAQAIAHAKTIALHGLGREGLQMKGLAMRLFHLGLDAHVVGEMTTRPVGTGDLLICCAGPGDFASIAALMNIAKDARARTAIVTAQPAAILQSRPIMSCTYRRRPWPTIKAARLPCCRWARCSN